MTLQFDQLTGRQVELAVAGILHSLNDAIAAGRRIEIRGFGCFTLSRQAPRKGRNPRSGERVDIAARSVPHFKPGKILRERVNSPSLQTGSAVSVRQ